MTTPLDLLPSRASATTGLSPRHLQLAVQMGAPTTNAAGLIDLLQAELTRTRGVATMLYQALDEASVSAEKSEDEEYPFQTELESAAAALGLGRNTQAREDQDYIVQHQMAREWLEGFLWTDTGDPPPELLKQLKERDPQLHTLVLAQLCDVDARRVSDVNPDCPAEERGLWCLSTSAGSRFESAPDVPLARSWREALELAVERLDLERIALEDLRQAREAVAACVARPKG